MLGVPPGNWVCACCGGLTMVPKFDHGRVRCGSCFHANRPFPKQDKKG